MRIFTSLNRKQKEAVGLLQIGTFLEYFDFMLYVHMAVLLNELFFPKTDPHTAALLTAFAFCSSYVLRPFGALLFGYIGDNIGRKPTVIITTMMMACSCVVMASLPTYAQIGISAAWIVSCCRIFQGLSSMGERIGAEVYIVEITRPPSQYPTVAMCSVSATLGTVFALAIASMVTMKGWNWRIAFWIGATIAVVGSIARTRLRETPDFIDAKKRRQIDQKLTERVNKKTSLCSFLINLTWPLFFFFVYVYCANILKNQFGFTSTQIIRNNFYVSLSQLLSFVLWMYLSNSIHPLRILKWKLIPVFVLVAAIPSFLIYNESAFNLFLLQLVVIFLTPDSMPAESILIKHFPVFKRVTYATFIYALSRALMYIVTSFSLIYLTEIFGPNGLLVIFIPTCVGYLYGITHFEKLENLKKNKRHIHNKPLNKSDEAINEPVQAVS